MTDFRIFHIFLFLRWILFSLFFVSLTKISLSQNYTYEYINNQKGLISNVVYESLIDSTGNLWLSTASGVVKYNGWESEVYTKLDGLPSNEIYHMTCDKYNRIWFTTFRSELCYYKNGKICNRRNDSLLGRIKNIGAFPRTYLDSYGLWIISYPMRLLRLTYSNEIENLNFRNYFRAEGFSFFQDSSQVYLINPNKTILVNKKNRSFESIKCSKQSRIDGAICLEDKLVGLMVNGELNYIGKVDLMGGKYYSIHEYNQPVKSGKNLITWDKNGLHFHDPNSLKYLFTLLKEVEINHVHCDVNGNIYVSTNGNGLIILKETSVINWICKDLRNKDNKISAIFVDSNNIVAGTKTGKILLIDRRSLHLKSTFDISKVQYVGSNLIKSICGDGLNYFGVGDKIIFNLIRRNKKFIFNVGKPRFPNSFKNLYLSGDTMNVLGLVGIHRFSGKSLKLIDSFYHNLRFYSYLKLKDKLYFGTERGLLEYTGKRFTAISMIPNQTRINSILGLNGELILAFSDLGIGRIKLTGYTEIIKSKTLTSTICNKILCNNSQIYGSSENGIRVLDTLNWKESVLGLSIGLRSRVINDICFFHDTLFAATEEGISVIPQPNNVKNLPVLFGVESVSDSRHTMWAPLTVFQTCNDQKIVFKLINRNYSIETRLKYFYRTSLDTNLISTIDNIIPMRIEQLGNCKVEFFAETQEGVRSAVKIINLNVQPYWYQTKIVKFIAVLFLIFSSLFILYFVYQYYRRSELRKLESKNKMNNLELSAWKASINPHFLFNSINSLQAFYRSNDLENAKKYSMNFSSLLRKTIDYSGQLLIDLGSEIEYISNYLNMELERKQGLKYFKIDTVSNSQFDLFIPSLLVQPVLENSIKHGMNENGEGRIMVIFKVVLNTVHCEVYDNGIGFDENSEESKNKGAGLKLIQTKIKIVEEVLNQRIGYSFANYYDDVGVKQGTKTEFVFPVVYPENKD